RTMVSAAMSIVMGLSGPVSILTGIITDRYGARNVIAAGGLFAVSGCLVMHRADALWQLYLFFGVFFGISISTCWAPLIGTVSRWFTGKRILAIGILTSGSTIGSVLIPPLIAPFIASYGWRTAFLILAFFILFTTSPALFFLGRKPDEIPEASNHETNLKGNATVEPEGSPEKGEWSTMKALWTLPYALLLAIGFVTAAGFFFMAVHMVPYATDMGIAATSAAFVLSFISLGNIAGKILIWPLAK
ncbi:MAG: MFS transporter, partial [Deltaproteobacteria bacterium]|nr:MFS transporter [Deltaproteobacteria bacterium]